MIVGRKPELSEDEAEALYLEYSLWLEARERYSPTALARKYGIDRETVRKYGKRIHKHRRAA